MDLHTRKAVGRLAEAFLPVRGGLAVPHSSERADQSPVTLSIEAVVSASSECCKVSNHISIVADRGVVIEKAHSFRADSSYQTFNIWREFYPSHCGRRLGRSLADSQWSLRRAAPTMVHQAFLPMVTQV